MKNRNIFRRIKMLCCLAVLLVVFPSASLPENSNGGPSDLKTANDDVIKLGFIPLDRWKSRF